MTIHKLLLGVGFALCMSCISLAANPAPEKPGPQELLLKDGRKVTVLWDRFKVQKCQLYMKGRTAFVNNERLQSQSPDVRRVIQWAAEDQGIHGDIEQHLKDSISKPLDERFVAAHPLVFELHYATGVDIKTGKKVTLPFCAVDPKDQVLIWDAANKMNVYRDYVSRENDRVAAAQAAAWAADEAADNTEKILDRLK